MREYDAQIGRFFRVDPLADYFGDQSIYSFSFNNPILMNDPAGLSPTNWIKKVDGSVIFDKDVTNQEEAVAKYGDGVTDLGKETDLHDEKTDQNVHGNADGSTSGKQLDEVVVTSHTKNTVPVNGASTVPVAPPNNQNVLNSPVGNATITSEFRVYRNVGSRIHLGTDYAVRPGTPVHAAAPGVVVRSDFSASYGNVIIINHGPSNTGQGNVYSLYAHGSARLAHLGNRVNTGDIILSSGSTGHVTGPHLHYEIIRTTIAPGQPGFYQNINIRFGPRDLANLIPTQ